MCCNDDINSCNYNTCNNSLHDDYYRQYHDLMPKYNYLKSLFDRRITIFDDNFTYFDLGSFLWDVDFIEKFRKEYVSDSFYILLVQLRKVYHLAYDAEQDISIRLNGFVEKSLGDQYRSIKRDDNLLCEKEV